MFVPGKPFQLSLMFDGKDGAYLMLQVLHSMVGPWPNPKH
jgi:hypothetical protein